MADLPFFTGIAVGGGTGGDTTGAVDLDVVDETLVIPDQIEGFSVENETLICL